MGFKCRRCMEEIKMHNEIMSNVSLCLLYDQLKDVMFTCYSI
jgi:hypothetical protein